LISWFIWERYLTMVSMRWDLSEILKTLLALIHPCVRRNRRRGRFGRWQEKSAHAALRWESLQKDLVHQHRSSVFSQQPPHPIGNEEQFGFGLVSFFLRQTDRQTDRSNDFAKVFSYFIHFIDLIFNKFTFRFDELLHLDWFEYWFDVVGMWNVCN